MKKLFFFVIVFLFIVNLNSQNYSLLYDGSNDFTTIISSSNTDTLSEYTIQAYIQSLPTSSQQPIVGINSPTNNHFLLGLNDLGKLCFKINGNSYVSNSTDLRDDQCHKITLYVKQNVAKLYVDGINKGSFSGNCQLVLNDTLLIGKSNNSFFNGKIDELLFWDSAIDILSLFTINSPYKMASTSNPLYYLPLREGSGNLIINYGTTPALVYRGSSIYNDASDPIWVFGECFSDEFSPERLGVDSLSPCMPEANPCNLVCNGNFEQYDDTLIKQGVFNPCNSLMWWPLRVGAFNMTDVPGWVSPPLPAQPGNSCDLYIRKGFACFPYLSPGAYALNYNPESWDGDTNNTAYVGIGAFNPGGLQEHEEIHAKLNSPLVSGKTYIISLYAFTRTQNQNLIRDGQLTFGFKDNLNGSTFIQNVGSVTTPYFTKVQNNNGWAKLSLIFNYSGPNGIVDSLLISSNPNVGLGQRIYTYIDDVAIHEYVTTNISSSLPNPLCINQCSKLQANPSFGNFGSFSWASNPFSNLGGITSDTLTVCPTTNTTYSVFATDTLSGCMAFDTITILVDTTCCSSGAANFWNNTSAKNINVTGVNVFTSTIDISGTFIVDTTVNLIGCNITLSPNAKIIILPNQTLTTQKCTLVACNTKMWDGIYISDSTANYRAFEDCIFKDAKNTVMSFSGGVYDIDDSKFINNYRGIWVHPYNNTHNGKVSNSLFTQEATLLNPYIGKTAASGVRIEQVFNPATPFGTAITVNGNNLFSHTLTGIKILHSTVEVYNNSFQYITPTGIIAFPADTFAGVLLVNNIEPNAATRVSFIGRQALSIPFYNNFKSCQFGVLAFSPQIVEVHRNSFDSCATAIKVEKIGNGVFAAYRNSITNGQIGFHSYNNAIGFVSATNNNIQNMYAGLRTAILFAEPTLPIVLNPNPKTASRNIINDCKVGIDFINITGGQANFNNILNVQPPNIVTPAYGIRLQGCVNIDVESNYIDNPTNNLGTSYGISAELSPNSSIRCNWTYEHTYGIRCAGTMPSDVLANLMRNNFSGFTLTNNGVIGAQFRANPQGGIAGPQDNKWIGNNFNYGTLVDSSNGLLSPFFNRNYGVFQSPGNQGVNTGTAIPMPKQGGRLIRCPFRRPIVVFANVLQNIAQNNFNAPVLTDTLLARQATIYSSVSFPQALNISGMANLAAAHYAQPIGKLDSINLSVAKDSCTTSHLNQCSNLQTTHAIDSNIKCVTKICLETALNQNGQLNVSQLSQLRFIAGLCPFTDGWGVYQARSILSTIDTAAYFNLCEFNSTTSLRTTSVNTEQEDKPNATFTIYPNPAKNSLTVAVDSETDVLDVIIYNQIGQAVYTNTVANYGKFYFNLPKGLYIIKLKSIDKEYLEKLIIE